LVNLLSKICSFPDSQKSPVIENQNLTEENEEILNDIEADEVPIEIPNSLEKPNEIEAEKDDIETEEKEILEKEPSESDKLEVEIEESKIEEKPTEIPEQKESHSEDIELEKESEISEEKESESVLKESQNIEIIEKESEILENNTIESEKESLDEKTENLEGEQIILETVELKESEKPEKLEVENKIEETPEEIVQEKMDVDLEETGDEKVLQIDENKLEKEDEIVEKMEVDETPEIQEKTEQENEVIENISGGSPDKLEEPEKSPEPAIEEPVDDFKEESTPESTQPAQKKFAFDDFMEGSDKADSDFEESEKIQNLLENMDDSQDSTSLNLVKTISNKLDSPLSFKSMLEKQSPEKVEPEIPDKAESEPEMEETKRKEKKSPAKRKQVLANVTPEKLELMTKEGMIKEVAGKKQLTKKGHRKMKEQMRSKKRKLDKLDDDELAGSSKEVSETDESRTTKLDPPRDDEEDELEIPETAAVPVPVEEESTKEETDLVEESVECDGEEKDEANTSGTSEDQIFAVGAETFGGPASCFYLCINKNGAITPIDYQPLYLDSTNQLVPRPDPPDVPEVEQENNNINVVINTPNGQLVLDEQTLYRLAAESGAGEITDGQQIVLSSDLIASLLNSQDIDPGTTEIIVANNANLADVEAQLVDPTFPPNAGLPPVTAHVSETSSVLTPRMATAIAPKIATSNTSNIVQPPVSSGTIDESLRIIGLTSQTRHVVPTSLELPITVTNPIIAGEFLSN
jgi:hypothetical protein